MGWEFMHDLGDRWLLENETGDDATDVRLEAFGKVVISGRANWTRDLPTLAAGDTVAIRFKVGFGGKADPPYLRITWTPAHQPEERYYEDVPFP